ncbi:hypothetical protein, partial [Altererythrobacter sp.]|uniref:hypothetical protein n=1 Tax=Altererythrobacter sp. TaxID=1872480 RepID=UPI00257BD943
ARDAGVSFLRHSAARNNVIAFLTLYQFPGTLFSGRSGYAAVGRAPTRQADTSSVLNGAGTGPSAFLKRFREADTFNQCL